MKIYLYILLSSIYLAVNAQNSMVVVQNSNIASNKTTINIKWYSQQFYYDEGVYVYRRSFPDGNWTRLNKSPLLRQSDIDSIIKKNDQNLAVWVEVMKKITHEQLSGLLMLNIMVESFNSHNFSRFCGIQFDDTTVVFAKQYQYKVNYLWKGSELFLGQSEVIEAKQFEQSNAPSDFSAIVKPKKVILNWKIEDNRFYGVNIYRKNNTGEHKLNKKPVMLSKVIDSLGLLSYPNIKYVDDSIQEGSSYSYSIAGLDFFGNETKRSVSIPIRFPDQTPPPMPMNLDATIDKLNVNLTWNIENSDDLSGYYLYRSTNDKKYERILNKPISRVNIKYTDVVPRPGNYYYFITSVDSVGNESPSQRIFKEVKDVFPPAKPKSLIARADTGKIYLSWEHNTDPDLLGYLIYRKTITKSNNGDFVLLNADPFRSNSFLNRLPRNTKNIFAYRIVAIDSSMNKSEYSNIAGVNMPDVKKPETPFIKNISKIDGNNYIEWIPNADSDLKGYNLLCKKTSDSTAPFKQVNVNLLSGDLSSFTDKWASKESEYTYYLVSIDSTGNESEPSNTYTSPKTLIIGNSSIVNKINATQTNKSIVINWEIQKSPNFIGSVLYTGENPESMKPLTGIITDNSYLYTPSDSIPIRFFMVKSFSKSAIKSESEIIKFEMKKQQ